MSALKEFATFITLNLANLATTYARLLAEPGHGYEAIPVNNRLTSGRKLLKAVSEACEMESSVPLCRLFAPQSVEAETARWPGHIIPTDPLQEVECLGHTLTPVVTNLEAGKFLWQLLSDARSTLLQDGRISTAAASSPVDDISLPGPVEGTLPESQALYQSLIDALPQNVYRVDRAGRIVFGNKTYLATIGMTLAECRGKTAYDLFPKELADKYTADDQRVIETGEVFNTVESHRVPATGETIYVQVLKSPVRNARGEIEGVQSIFWDVTNRVQTEQALAQERDLLQALLDNSPDYIFFKDAESRIIRSNKAHAALLGFADPHEAVGKTDFDLFQPEHAQRYYDEEQQIIQSGQPVIDRVGQTPDSEGNILWLSETKIPLTDETGQKLGLFGISRNITARQLAEEKLAKQAVELKAIAEISTVATAILERDQILQQVVDLTKDRFGLYHAHIYLLDEFGETLKLAAGAGEVGRQMVSQGWRIPVAQEQSLVAQTARTGQGVIENDVRQNPHYLPNPLLPETRSEMVVPLIIGGLVLGVLDVQSDQLNRFTEEDVRIKTALASQVAVALQNAEQYEFAQQASQMLGKRVQELNCLNELGREMEESPPLAELLPWIAGRIPRAMQYPELCQTAIEFDGNVYGAAEAIDLPAQMTHGLYVKGQVGGRVYIAYSEKHDFLDEESALLGAVATRLGGYIENRRLLEETEAALAETEMLAQEQAVLTELGQALAARLSVDQVLQEAYRQTSRLVDTTNFYLGLYDPVNEKISFPLQVSESKIDLEITVIRADQGLAGYMVRHRTSLFFEDNVRARQEALGIKMVGQEALSWLGVPLMIGDEVLGVMAVQSHTTPRLYDEHDRELLTAIANQVAIALQNARHFEATQAVLAEVRQAQAEAESRLQETQVLQQLTQRLASAIELTEIVQAFFWACQQLLGADYGIFSLVDQPAQRVGAVGGFNVSDDHLRRANHPLDSRDIMADIVRTGQTDVITGWDPRFDAENFEAEGMAEWGLRIFTPITVRQEHIGLVEVGFKEKADVAVQENQLRLLRTLIDQAAIALESSQRYQASQRMAHREQTIREITEKMRAAVSLEQLIKTATTELGERLSAGHALVEVGLAPAGQRPEEGNGHGH